MSGDVCISITVGSCNEGIVVISSTSSSYSLESENEITVWSAVLSLSLSPSIPLLSEDIPDSFSEDCITLLCVRVIPQMDFMSNRLLLLTTWFCYFLVEGSSNRCKHKIMKIEN